MNIACIFAGGTGKRMGHIDLPKQFYTIMGKPIIVHTLEVFQHCRAIDHIVVACLEDRIDQLQALVARYGLTKVTSIVPGGETGQLSIYQTLLAARALAGNEDPVVLVHDGVRPLITSELIERNIRSVELNGSAISCGRMTETPVVLSEDGTVDSVPDRERILVAKAPQSFRLRALLQAHEQALSEGRLDFIDCCSLMRHYGHRLHRLECAATNIKVTTFDDLHLLIALLQARDNAANFFGEGSDDA